MLSASLADVPRLIQCYLGILRLVRVLRSVNSVSRTKIVASSLLEPALGASVTKTEAVILKYWVLAKIIQRDLPEVCADPRFAQDLRHHGFQPL